MNNYKKVVILDFRLFVFRVKIECLNEIMWLFRFEAVGASSVIHQSDRHMDVSLHVVRLFSAYGIRSRQRFIQKKA